MLTSDAETSLTMFQLAGVDLPLSLAVIAGIGVLYALYLTLSPLLEESEISSEEWSRMEDESLALLAKRDRVIAELKDLEFEAAMNKIDAADLSKLRGQYEREALRLIEALDQQASSYNSDIQENITATREAARARKAQTKKEEEQVKELSDKSAPQEQEAHVVTEDDSVVSKSGTAPLPQQLKEKNKVAEGEMTNV